jgi:hypothetical protein
VLEKAVSTIGETRVSPGTRRSLVSSRAFGF